MNMLRRMSLVALVLVLGLIAAACGGDDDTSSETTEGTVPPLETTTTAEVVEETTTTAAPAEETTTTAAVEEFDLVAAVGEYESTIPDGWMAVGDTAAFKEAVEASGALVIDVREVSEYDEGHIPGAVNIPIRTLGQNTDKIPTDTQVFVYCASGFRASMATSALRMMGYDNVLGYSGSYKAWTEAGEEVSVEATEAEVVGDPGLTPELVAAVDAWLSALPEGWNIVGTVEDVQAALDNGSVIVDVRTPDEYDAGHIPGAISVPLRTITENMSLIPTDTQFIVHCKSGWRAGLSMPVVGVLGFDNAKVFPGGWNAWEAAGAEVEAG